MATLSPETIRTIAEALEAGKECYVHREAQEVIALGDPERDPTIDPDEHEMILERIETSREQYLHFERMPTDRSFAVMTAFIDRVRDQELWQELSYAIKRPRPFRNFRKMLETDPEYYQKWLNFRTKRYLAYVEEQLEAMTAG